MNTLYNNIRKSAQVLTVSLSLLTSGLFCACSDFLDQTSDRVIDAEEQHLVNASDTIYSVLGIVNKLQAIADRTNLLGEVRADLVDIGSTTASDLRDVALFNVANGNSYDQPADYYAVINNCNYYLANVDLNLKNARGEYIFRKEYAVVKAFRAWTYLQLVLNYREVPFITEPILTKEQSERNYPRYDLQQICQYFIADLQGLEDEEIPEYGTLRGVDSRLFYFPIRILLGDLQLWAGNYRDAAVSYYQYLTHRNGTNSAAPIGVSNVGWLRSDTHWQKSSDTWGSSFINEKYGSDLITLIPSDSIPAEGNYSQLRNTYNGTAENNYTASLSPSQSIRDLSAKQTYCHFTEANNVIYAPSSLEGLKCGDLRLQGTYYNTFYVVNGKMSSTSVIDKHITQNVHIYRQTMVYLRMAEALNRAGFPRFAFQILKTGINNSVLQQEVLPYYPDDADYLSQFDFPSTQYILRTSSELSTENTMGLHSHGSGWTDRNEYYIMPDDDSLTGEERLQYQILGVEDLLVDEEALEFAFEGYRFYDLMRVALRRDDPAYLADRIYQRRGADNVSEMRSLIQKDLYQTDNWYLKLP